MMHRVTHTNTLANELQNAAELRRNQAAAPPTTQKAGAQYNFAEIFGGNNNWGAAEEAAAAAPAPSTEAASNSSRFHSAIATATAMVVGSGTGTRGSVIPPAATTDGTTPTAAAAPTPAATTPVAATVTTPGVGTLVTAIMNGSFQPTYVTNPAQLQETTPFGTDTMPNFYYASDQTATQLAQLLGGTVVKMPAFGQGSGFSEPNANFIQLPNGQTFNAADVAYYARCGNQGSDQLTADITATINQGSAWTNYYKQGGDMPSFARGYVGPPISGSTYASDMIGSNGNVINPAMQQSGV